MSTPTRKQLSSLQLYIKRRSLLVMAFVPSAQPVRLASHCRIRSPVCARTVVPAFSRRTLLKAATALCLLPVKMSAAQSDVQKEDLVEGTGAGFKSGDTISVHYTLTLGAFDSPNVVDSSRSRGRPFSYRYDTGSVIKGWDLGVAGMKVGGRRRLVIPSQLGYGAAGAGGVIPPNSTLYFDIQLLRVGS